MFRAEAFAKTFEYAELFVQGLVCTVSLSALTVVFGFILALALAVMRLSDIHVFRFLSRKSQRSLTERGGVLYALARFNPLRFLSTVYVEVFRATPMLVQLFIIYHVVLAGVGIPTFKLFGYIRFERFVPCVVALALNSAAYLCEIIRAGIQSIDGGQTEAARSLGMSPWKTMRFVVLPQAIKNILPAIGNEFVTIIKESSICYTVGVQDIMYAVTTVKSAIYTIAEPLVVATCVYFCLTFPTSKIIAHFERKMSAGDRRSGADTARTRKRKIHALKG